MYSGSIQDGQNIINDQKDYDLIFKDVCINSQFKQNTDASNYKIDIGTKIDKIYKAELLEFSFNDPQATYNSNKVFLSLGTVLDNNTLIVPTNGIGSIPPVFCQIPVVSLTNYPYTNYTSVQLYNPPVNNVINLYIKFYDIDGTEIPFFPEHSFTLRFYYFEKRNTFSSFYTPINANYTGKF
jgi:hypothetical protein